MKRTTVLSVAAALLLLVSLLASVPMSADAAAKPALSGPARVGEHLVVKPGKWSRGAKVTYRWYRGTHAIAGASRSSYLLNAADAGKHLRVKVTAVRSGHHSTFAVSSKLVAKGRLAVVRSGSITGSTIVDSLLSVSGLRWSSPVSQRYQWKANGIAISGATSNSLVIGDPQYGAVISVVVSASKPGYLGSSVTMKTSTAVTRASAISGDGTYIVGSTVSADTYVTTTSTQDCYWERLSGFDGTLDSIIVNDFASGQRIVTISPTDVGFKSSRCGSWMRLSEVPTAPGASIPEGQFAVGIQITPGTYSAPGSDFCYWETESGFGGTLDELISNDIVTGTAVVSIAPGTVGFSSHGCGTWTRIG